MRKLLMLTTVFLLTVGSTIKAQQMNMTKLVMRVGKISSLVPEEKRKATCAEILADPRLSIDNPGYKVQNYSVGIKQEGDNNYLGPYLVKGEAFTPEVIAAIKAQAGKKGSIQIESIKIIGPDEQTRTVNPLNISFYK